MCPAAEQAHLLPSHLLQPTSVGTPCRRAPSLLHSSAAAQAVRAVPLECDSATTLMQMDTLGIEPRASRMLSECDTTTPCALGGQRKPGLMRPGEGQSVLVKSRHQASRAHATRRGAVVGGRGAVAPRAHRVPVGSSTAGHRRRELSPGLRRGGQKCGPRCCSGFRCFSFPRKNRPPSPLGAAPVGQFKTQSTPSRLWP